MPKQSKETTIAKAIVKEKNKLVVENSEIRFSAIDQNNILIELVWKNDELVYLIWDGNEPHNKTRIGGDYVLTRNKLMIIPPAKTEKFLDDMLIPRITDEKELPEKLKNFSVTDLDAKIEGFLRRWFILPEEYFLILRLFIKFSWVHEKEDLKTYLSIWGDRGTGKTRLGTYLSWLCRFPYFNKSGATPAVLARAIDLVRGIAIIDESDMYLNNTEETASFMRILKGNETTSTYDVVDEHRKIKFPRRIHVGVPKVILSAKPIKDDHVSSRSIILELKPVEVPKNMRMDTRIAFRNERRAEAQEIVDELLLFRLHNFFDLSVPQTILEGIEPRYGDVANPLFNLINNMEEHKIFNDFVVKNVKQDLEHRSETNEGQILACIKTLFEMPIETQELFKSEHPKIFLDAIVAEMKKTYYSDVNEREAEKIVNNRRIGWSLKNVGVKTRKGSDGKRFVDPDYFDLLEPLYRRFGIIKEVVEEGVLTNKIDESIMNINIKEKENNNDTNL